MLELHYEYKLFAFSVDALTREIELLKCTAATLFSEEKHGEKLSVN